MTTALSNITEKEKALKEIINLGEKNDLRHGPIIDKDEGVFVFKSTNETHIRFSYTFEMNKKGNITSIRIFDFVTEKFNHETYLEKFRRNYPVSKTLLYTIITIPKRGKR